MKIQTVGWVIGSLGLLLGAGTARAEQAQEVTGSDIANQMAQRPVCKDAGVTVSFATGSYELDQNAKGALNGVATWMKADPSRTLHLQGYADTTGETDANFVLSEHRAQAAKDYLVSQGVETTRIMTAGRGEHLDHLPAEGRTVTFLACQPPSGAQAQAETQTSPQPEAQMPAQPQAQAEPPAPIEVVPPPPPAPETYPAAVPAASPVPWGTRFGWAFMAGGAYTDFTQQDMKARTNAGGAWDARIVGGTNSVIGFEAAYIGAARTLETLGVTGTNTPALVSNGAEGTLRVNAPFHSGESLIEPYGFVGVGWSHYTVSNYNSNRAVTSDFSQSDDVMNVPIGGGFAYGYRAFIIDARASWTPTYYNNLLQNTNGTGTLNTWGVGGQLGFKF